MNVRSLADPALESGVPNGRALLDFASAVAGGGDAELERSREALRSAMGDAGVADAAAVASNFERMVRIADSIGIELGDWMETFTEGVRSDLVLDRLRSGPDDSREFESRAVGA
ncbi:MAG: hypothetical protein OXC01_14430 [Immundisolibacterales bacterium]|nr:hypothetical protein [Immundisolibacterales bacterium]